MPSKFGGVEVKEESGSKFGGVPVEEPPLPDTFGRPAKPTKQMSEFMQETSKYPVLGGPVAPSPSQLLTAGVSTGVGALAGTGSHALARRFGADEETADLIGNIVGLGAGILTVPRAGLIQKAIKVRKTPAVASALRSIWNKSGLGGWSELEAALGPKPYPAGKGTGTKYGGAYKPELQVGTQIPRGKFTPPTEPPAEVKPYAPVRPNPNIARKLKSGGSADPYKGRSYRNLPRKVSRVNPTETEAAITEGAPAEEASLEDKLRESVKQQQAKNKFRDAEAHVKKVKKVANILKSSGIPTEQLEQASVAQRKDFLHEAGVKKFSDLDTAWNEILDEIRGQSSPAKGPTPPLPASRFEK